MSADRYISGAQQRVLAAIGILSERPLHGIRIEHLAQRLGCSRDQAYRTLQNLELGGWVTDPTRGQGDAVNPGYRLTPLATQLSERVRLAIADLHRAYLGDLT